MSDERNPLEQYVERLDDPARRDPQRNNPRARWSKATAKSALFAITKFKAAVKMGKLVDGVTSEYELRRAERILTIIINSDTEEVIEDE